jgi:hypothetical protein
LSESDFSFGVVAGTSVVRSDVEVLGIVQMDWELLVFHLLPICWPLVAGRYFMGQQNQGGQQGQPGGDQGGQQQNNPGKSNNPNQQQERGGGDQGQGQGGSQSGQGGQKQGGSGQNR